ncbi:MAG: TIGR00269 family protein [Methanomassiliicoccales archaeon]|nr:TIGR00269 family protein [Methanomassiliicoccales archaeon]
MQCIKCSKEAVEYVRYNGSHLCEEHFLEYVERRVKKEIRQQVDLEGKSKVAVALSGGKDSSVALYIMHLALRQRRDISVVAITVDEGISGYRPRTMEKAKELTRSLGIEHLVISFQGEVGMTMDGIAKASGDKGPCTYCGVIRRRCMNKVARDVGADVLATGLNLDDTAQSILMNFTRGDVERLARLGPHQKVQPGLIPRIQPLRAIPEKESYLYAMLRRLPFSDDECPYADLALRNEYRAIVDGLEAKHTGTKFAIVASYDAIRPSLAVRYPQADLQLCDCGEPTCNQRCMACELLEEVRKMV